MPMPLDEWADLLNMASKQLRKHVASELVKTAFRAEREAKLRVTGGGSTRLNVRTGRLRASIAGRVNIEGDTIEVSLVAGGVSPAKKQKIKSRTSSPGAVRYARIHEEGGSIKARGKLLAIPIHSDLFTAGGKQRYAGPRDVPNLVFAISKAGKPFLFDKFKGTSEAYYLLRERVDIPARPYLAPGLRTAAIQMDNDVYRAIENLLSPNPATSTAGV